MSLTDIGIGLGSRISQPATYAITAFLSIALYNVIELTFLLFIVFKRHGGLYFWSFLIATWGIALYAVGFILNDFKLAESIRLFNVTLIVIGWTAMVTGQSLVLYSRLHLIVRSRLILRLVLGMIITNAVLLHIPIIILCYGANSVLLHRRFTYPYGVYERIQVTVFFIQETIISCIYMYEICRLLYLGGGPLGVELHGEDAGGRRLMMHLIYVNIIVIILDVAILVLQFSGRYASQTAAKGLIYSVKLKIEFSILNRLVEFTQASSYRWPSSSGDGGSSSQPNFIEQGLRREGAGRGTQRRHRYSCPWQIFRVKVEATVGERSVQG
ncbi:hypothetical protein BJX64DRAFT_302077 [Aspergillus heterothallicus]